VTQDKPTLSKLYSDGAVHSGLQVMSTIMESHH